MPQFSVYKNKNPKTRSTYPYLLDVQTDLLSGLGAGVVAPLVKRTASAKRPPAGAYHRVNCPKGRLVSAATSLEVGEISCTCSARTSIRSTRR